MRQNQVDFLLRHYQQLHERNARYSELRWTWMRLSVIGTVIYFAILLSDKSGFTSAAIFPYFVWLPAILNILALIGSYGLWQSLYNKADLMRDIERKLGVIGWETYWKNDLGPFKVQKHSLLVSTIGFWVLMIGVSLAIPIADAWDPTLFRTG